MSNPIHKVTIQNGYEILVDGVRVGHLEGRSEVYVILGGFPNRGEAVARFKRYLNKSTAKTLASRWVKFVLARMSHEDVIKKIGFNQPNRINNGTTPMQLAWDLGMPKPVAPSIPSPKTWEEAAKAPVIFVTA